MPRGLGGLLVGGACGLLVAAPVLPAGYVLSYDQVAVPAQPLTAATFGLDGSVPRAVPTDLVLAALGRAIPGDVVQKLLLLACFVLAAWGVARLVPGRAPGVAAAVAYVWNAYVAERLVIGHWSLLLGYALLPWAAGAALAVRMGARRLPQVCLWVFAAALCGATAGVIVAATVFLLLWWPGRGRTPPRRAALLVAGFAVAANAPWWVPAVLRPGGIPADAAGISAFASRPDTPLGLLGSLLTVGGIWNHAVVPAERGVGALALAALLAILVALALGAGRVARQWDGGGAALLAAGALGLLLAGAASLPGARWLLRVAVLHLPGGGLLRDGQKFLAPLALVLALCTGAAVSRLLARPRPELAVLALALAIVPLVVLPGLAWGSAGRLEVAHYPADWFAVRRLIVASPDRGDIAVFPWWLYRRYPWNGDRITLDPAPRFFPRPVVVNDDLPLTGGSVRGEDERAAAIGAALADRSAGPSELMPRLAALGIRFVVVEHRSGRPTEVSRETPGQRTLFTGTDLDLLEVVGPVRRWDSGLPPVAGAGLVACAVSGLTAGAFALRRWHSEELDTPQECGTTRTRSVGHEDRHAQ